MKGVFSNVNYRIAVHTMDEMEVVKNASFNEGFTAGRALGVVEGQKETWRALTSVAMLGTIVAVALVHFNSLI